MICFYCWWSFCLFVRRIDFVVSASISCMLSIGQQVNVLRSCSERQDQHSEHVSPVNEPADNYWSCLFTREVIWDVSHLHAAREDSDLLMCQISGLLETLMRGFKMCRVHTSCLRGVTASQSDAQTDVRNLIWLKSECEMQLYQRATGWRDITEFDWRRMEGRVSVTVNWWPVTNRNDQWQSVSVQSLQIRGQFPVTS